MRNYRTRYLLAIIFIGGVIRLFLAWSNLHGFLLRYIPDDGFYYFRLARNVADGFGPTFDRLGPTNGYHPLWLGVIVPIFKLFNLSLDFPVHVTLSVSAGFDLICAVLVYAIVFKVAKEWRAATLAALIYGLNPNAIFQSINGLESALGCLFFGLSAYVFVDLRENKMYPLRKMLLLGMLLGLAVLARSDNVFLFLIMVAIIFWEAKGWKKKVTLVGAVVGMGCLLVWPWMIYIYLVFGTVIQVSGLALPYQLQTLYFNEHGAGVSWGLAGYLLSLLVQGFVSLLRQTGLQEVLVLFAGAIFFIYWKDQRHSAKKELATSLYKLDFLFLFGLLLTAFHTMVRWYPRRWYFVPTNFSVAVVLGVVLAYLLQRCISEKQKSRLSQVAALVIFLSFLLTGLLLVCWKGGSYAPQVGFPQLVKKIEAEVGVHGRYGMTDAGYVGYYSKAQIINLDGVVNNAAFAAIREGKLLTYIKINKIEHYSLGPITNHKCFLGGD